MASGASAVTRSNGYLPIRAYGLIGDCHGSALVGCDGAIDWCCLRRFDADPVFCRILDADRGGFLLVAPVGDYSTRRSYVPDTNVLETMFTTAEGELAVTDFMPVGRKRGSGTHNYVDLNAPHWLVRCVEARRGAIALRVRYRPSFDFARKRARINIEKHRITTHGGTVLLHNLGSFHMQDEVAEAFLTLLPGQRLVLVVAAENLETAAVFDRIEHYREVTVAFWKEWIAYCRYQGAYSDAVKRSLLTIKLLIYAPSGALVAAPTTSLPEAIGGPRNWDYRYCWLRDTSFALYALGITGYGGEARRFSEYLSRVCRATAPDLRIMYGIEAETELEEKALDHLDGYMGSRPVRAGNGAYRQHQLDVFGELLDWAMLFQSLGGKLDKGERGMLAALADHVADHWREPDYGIWEMRTAPTDHVHGKIMSWVALDRAIRLVGENDRWRRERDRIAVDVRVRGGIDTYGRLVQVYDRSNADAALLRAPFVAFPATDDVMRSTVTAVEQELRSGDFLRRYRTDDGLTGEEGAILIASFWLVDAYLHLGRYTEAKQLFERLLAHANDVGLYAEEIDPDSKAFLGNFPQAYTHLAVITTAAHLQLYEQGGREALRGSDANRAKLMIHATLGWKAIWAAFKASGKVGRIFPSKYSVLE